MGHKDRVCVFDLDGTLWEENSHIAIVEKYYKTQKYSSLFGKLFCLLMFNEYMKCLNRDYGEIPKEYIEHYSPHFREDAILRLEAEKKAGAYVIIISNAPQQIVDIAGKRLAVPAYRADISKKDVILKDVIGTWEYLIVVTDNLSDASIIELADETVIYTSNRRKQKFKKLKLPNKTEFKSID